MSQTKRNFCLYTNIVRRFWYANYSYFASSSNESIVRKWLYLFRRIIWMSMAMPENILFRFQIIIDEQCVLIYFSITFVCVCVCVVFHRSNLSRNHIDLINVLLVFSLSLFLSPHHSIWCGVVTLSNVYKANLKRAPFSWIQIDGH